MILVPVFLLLLVHYIFKVTNSNDILIQFDAQSHKHIVNSNTSKLESKRLFNAIGIKLISDFENNPINKGCKYNRKGECKPKGCKSRRASSRSMAG